MLAAAFLPVLVAMSPASALPADQAPIECSNCVAWNAPRAPFRLFGDSWYVGPQGIASVLVDTGEGLVLIDGALPQSAAGIAANVRALGFEMRDVRWILSSHAHWDHAGGIAALQRMSGARVAASPRGAAALRAGAMPADDPQAGWGPGRFPALHGVVAVADGATVALGGVVFTAHHMPGHAPGSTSWSWRGCERGRCATLVFGDSLNPVATPEYRYGEAATAAFRASLARMQALPCDLLVAAHPGQSRLFERLAAREAGDADALLDGGCRAYADDAARRLDARLAEDGFPPPQGGDDR